MRRLTHLQELEAESIHIFREVVAEFQRPVMLYSIGKDSSVMLRLAQKAFFPGKIPFPLLHIDTGYKFREMIEFRDRQAQQLGLKLIVHTNQAALDEGTNPFKVGTQRCSSECRGSGALIVSPSSGSRTKRQPSAALLGARLALAEQLPGESGHRLREADGHRTDRGAPHLRPDTRSRSIFPCQECRVPPADIHSAFGRP